MFTSKTQKHMHTHHFKRVMEIIIEKKKVAKIVSKLKQQFQIEIKKRTFCKKKLLTTK